MFGGNQKISGRQLERLLVLDGVGKAGLLLPRFAGRVSGRTFLLSLLTAVFLTLGYTWCIARLSRKIENDFYSYVCFRLGRPTAVFLCFLYWMYTFVNVLFLLRLFAAIAVTFVLPETPEWILIVIASLTGIYAASGGLEVRARFSEVIYPFVVYPLILLLILAAAALHPEAFQTKAEPLSWDAACRGAQMFTAFGGIGLFLYLIPFAENQKTGERALFRGIGKILAGEFFLFLIILGTFGEQGMKALPWPFISLMSSVEIRGVFLQRWDVIFTVLLLGSFFAALATGMYYLGFLTGKIFSVNRNRKLRLFWPAAVVTAAACVCRDYQTAVKIYTLLNGSVFLPAAIFFTILLLILEHVREGRQ